MRRLRSKCLLCDGARDGNRYVCWCPAAYARAFKIVDQPRPAIPRSIRHIFVPEQVYQNPHAVIFATSMAHGDLRGRRPPDDGRLDFLMDEGVEEGFLPDMFGMFKYGDGSASTWG
jgi:hypothetical protein